MAYDTNKRRTFRCTDLEWELIEKNAELANMSVNQYMILKSTEGAEPLILKPEQQRKIFENVGRDYCNPLMLTLEEQRKLQRGIRLISYYILERYEKDGRASEVIHDII